MNMFGLDQDMWLKVPPLREMVDGTLMEHLIKKALLFTSDMFQSKIIIIIHLDREDGISQ